ncbi:Nse1 non-SMC component of SMC5-6 complex-domain-containing protein [Xylariaceae sp. FL1019]|nr:Nse1 non-SMC component of SMC5-6 complex-domain-containing protein [Xylariaceae sp. FL1019]
MSSDEEERGDVSSHYDDSNRAFLQAFLARGTMTLKDAQPILAAIFTAQKGENNRPEQITQEDLDSYISAARVAISPFDLEIRSTFHQLKRDKVYAIVNTTSDPMTQLATLHTPDEIAFVKRVIDAMFEKYNTPRMEAICLDDMQANKLRVPPAPSDQDLEGDENAEVQTQISKGLRSSEVETMMRSMVAEGWFECSREGFYYLSPRALMELRSWLIESYNEPDAEEGEWQRVKFCQACREVVTIGQRCRERDCLVRLHDGCADAFFRTRRERTCPKCSGQWSGKHFVGERAVTETEAYQRGRRRSNKGGRSSNVNEEIMQDEEDEEGEDEDGDEEE